MFVALTEEASARSSHAVSAVNAFILTARLTLTPTLTLTRTNLDESAVGAQLTYLPSQGRREAVGGQSSIGA